MTAATAATAVLLLLAVYHLAIGLASALAPRAAARIGAALYAIQAPETPQLRYGLRMLGLYALAIGALCALAAADPAAHRPLIAVLAGLQLARAIARLALQSELAAAFGVPARRNLLNASLLLAEAGILFAALPRL